MWAYLLTSKDQAFETFKEFKEKVEKEAQTKLKMLRTDRGGKVQIFKTSGLSLWRFVWSYNSTNTCWEEVYILTCRRLYSLHVGIFTNFQGSSIRNI
ncbi:putative RNA-directed DNA polymerase [Helianthus anomalus]